MAKVRRKKPFLPFFNEILIRLATVVKKTASRKIVEASTRFYLTHELRVVLLDCRTACNFTC